MVKVKEQYPFIDEDGNEDLGLILHWAEDDEGNRYYLKQVETGIEYEGAIDIYPCPYTYQATNKPLQDEEE